MSSPAHRRKPPRPGALLVELRTVLAAAGLPASPTSERYRAHGLVLSDDVQTGSATVEWFVSRSLRRAAADEQMQGVPQGQACSTQESVRRHMHRAIHGILQEAGYDVQLDALGYADRQLRVSARRPAGPAALAADLRRLIAELGKERD